MIKITGVVTDSPAQKAGIHENDMLFTLNGHKIADVLDYMFYAAEDRVIISVRRNDKTIVKKIIKGEYDDLGLEFDRFLMDEKQSCRNKCVFCFIDQLPEGMRDTLYFKDDDARLSFLHGNYITLTNMSDEDADRIIKMHLNVNISVHTTNPELRCRMMGNRFAGEKLKDLKQFAEAGIMMNCQIVLCPGYNDGTELDRTLNDLAQLMPNIQSIAVVPVGLTKFREGLEPLQPVTREKALEVITHMSSFESKMLKKYGTRLAYPADEFFLLAGMQIPNYEFYEDYPQYENGVGMLRLLHHEFCAALGDTILPKFAGRKLVATGTAAFPMISKLVGKVTSQTEIDCKVVAVKNNYFGENITVAGLITGCDLVAQLKLFASDYELLLIPQAMLRAQSDVFLDNMTIAEAEEKLGISIRVVGCDGEELLKAIIE